MPVGTSVDESTLVTPQSVDGDAPLALECPEPGCDYVAEGRRARFFLGAHRANKHGISGDPANRRHKARRAPSQPKPRAPSRKQIVKKNVETVYGLGSMFAAPVFPTLAGATQHNLPTIADAWAANADQEWCWAIWGMAGEASVRLGPGRRL